MCPSPVLNYIDYAKNPYVGASLANHMMIAHINASSVGLDYLNMLELFSYCVAHNGLRAYFRARSLKQIRHYLGGCIVHCSAMHLLSLQLCRDLVREG